MKYTDIRKKYQYKFGLSSIHIDAYSCILSPFFTKLFLKLKLLPNEITILMIVSGVIGAILFSLPSIIAKIAGIIFIHLWYIFDCSDGEVARINGVFSQYGKELDYMAHTVNHPLFIVSFVLTSNYFGYFTLICFILYMLLGGIDSYFRMSYSLLYIETLRGLSLKSNKSPQTYGIRDVAVYVISFFVPFPNFAVIFPIVMLINMDVANCYLVVEVLIGGMVYVHGLYKWLKKVRKR